MSMPGFNADASLYKTTMHYCLATGRSAAGDYLAPAQLASPLAVPPPPCDCHQCYLWCAGSCFQRCRQYPGTQCYPYCMDVCTSSCDSFCGPGFVRCRGGCVDLSSDPHNCGRCGNMCTGGHVCQDGACICSDPALTDCSGVCTSLRVDTANCGACGRVCPPTDFCSEGKCIPVS